MAQKKTIEEVKEKLAEISSSSAAEESSEENTEEFVTPLTTRSGLERKYRPSTKQSNIKNSTVRKNIELISKLENLKSIMTGGDKKNNNNVELKEINLIKSLMSEIPILKLKNKNNNSEISEFFDFINSVVKVLTEDQKLIFIKLLRFKIIQEVQDRLDPAAFESIVNLKKEIKLKFLKKENRSIMKEKLKYMRQDEDENLDLYGNKFIKFLKEYVESIDEDSNLVKDEDKKILKDEIERDVIFSFKRNLKNIRIKEKLFNSSKSNLNEIIKEAKEIEQIDSLIHEENLLEKIKKDIKEQAGKIERIENEKFQMEKNKQKTLALEIVEGLKNLFPNQANNKQNDLICYFCNKKGHKISDCFSRSRQNCNQSNNVRYSTPNNLRFNALPQRNYNYHGGFIQNRFTSNNNFRGRNFNNYYRNNSNRNFYQGQRNNNFRFDQNNRQLNSSNVVNARKPILTITETSENLNSENSRGMVVYPQSSRAQSLE